MKKYLILALIVLFFLLSVFLPKDFSLKEEDFFLIEKGWGSKEIALNLEKEGLITWGPIFRVYVHVRGISGDLQAGEYLLSSSMSISQIASKIAIGDIAKTKITIPEGFTIKQIEDMLEIEINPDLEGFLFPDTYYFSHNATGEEIIKKISDNFNKKTEGLAITPEMIIMASILEKEVKTKEEKELASGILWKRLNIGMALQVDAAPITYERRGLPDNPICNPGLESILAALSPQESSYWYYLSRPDTGETLFSETLEEHNILKAKYLK